ncbi:MAG TPA: Flp family type IVb pilin [Thermoleophilaceae bacterium]
MRIEIDSRWVAAGGAQDGQALVEYALITSIVSIVAIAILGTIGSDLVTLITSVANAF